MSARNFPDMIAYVTALREETRRMELDYLLRCFNIKPV